MCKDLDTTNKSLSMAGEKVQEWVVRDESVSCLLPFSWLSSSSPFPSYSLISLPYFSSLHSCDLLGAKDAREKVASPRWLTYRIADAGTPWKTWSHILFRDISALHSRSSHRCLPQYPLRGHLHGNKWFLQFVPQADFVLQRASWGSEQEVTEVCFQLAPGRNAGLGDTLWSILILLWHRKLWTFLASTPGMTGCRKQAGLVRTEWWWCWHWESRCKKLASLICHQWQRGGASFLSSSFLYASMAGITSWWQHFSFEPT